jgi:hypothetical protein
MSRLKPRPSKSRKRRGGKECLRLWQRRQGEVGACEEKNAGVRGYVLLEADAGGRRWSPAVGGMPPHSARTVAAVELAAIRAKLCVVRQRGIGADIVGMRRPRQKLAGVKPAATKATAPQVGAPVPRRSATARFLSECGGLPPLLRCKPNRGCSRRLAAAVAVSIRALIEFVDSSTEILQGVLCGSCRPVIRGSGGEPPRAQV